MARARAQMDQQLIDTHPDALSIATLYSQVEGALVRVFPRARQIWVRGEIQHITDQHGRTGHCYIDLIDPDTARDRQAPVLRVKCWRTTWAPLRATLGKEGIELAPGMVVLLRGNLDFYRPKAEISFVLSELDVTALLGRLAARRAALLRTLAEEGLLERNGSLDVPPVPLKIGLVASPATEGYRDFLGQLTGSAFGFSVSVWPVTVQGARAPGAIARAISGLGFQRPDLDLLVLVRGGGSKADLAPFDAEPVARAIATSPFPVWTGIGHTGDESVADIVGNRTCVTPTACGRELVLRVAEWWESHVVSAAQRVGRCAVEHMVASETRSHGVRGRLSGNAQHHLHRQGELLVARAGLVGRLAPRVIEVADESVTSRADRLGPLAHHQLQAARERLHASRRLLAAYDVERQLERGYTLTTDGQGRILRRADDAVPGSVLITRFADGTARSVVEGTESQRVGSAEPGGGS